VFVPEGGDLLQSIMAVNAVGQVAFWGKAVGSGTFASGAGVWATTTAGRLVSVLRVGDMFDTNPDPLVTNLQRVTLVGFVAGGGGGDGLSSSLNDAGEVALCAGFADGTYGVYVAKIGCVGDFNHSGGVSTQDIFDFLNAWFAADPNADVNGADSLTVQDIFDFLNAWFLGCS
jgi:hypothetical protein